MDASIRLMRIIWMAMVVSVVLYGFIAWLMAGSGEVVQPIEQAIQQPVVQILYGLGVMTFVLSSVVPRLVLRGRGAERHHGNPPPAVVPSEIRMALIIRFAMLESVAIFGLVSAFVSSDARLVVPPAMLSLVGFLMAFPSESLIQRMDQMRR